MFYFYFPAYILALVGLIVSRSRRWDMLFLAWAIAINLLAGSAFSPARAGASKSA